MAKKTKTDAPEKEGSTLLDKALNKLNDRFGGGYIKTLTELNQEPLVGISTGSLGLDWIINPKAGGIAKGHAIEVYGPYSSGKTTMTLGICANATANDEHVLYIDAEGGLRQEAINNAGVRPDLFHYVDEIDARISANAMEDLIITGEISVAVIDSIPTWKPIVEGKKGEEEVDFTKPRVAEQSLFLSNTLPHLCRIARKHGVVLVFVNQIRDRIGGHVPGTKPYGGRILEHQDTVRIKFTGRATNVNDRIMDSDGNLIGQHTTCFCDKNKLHTPMGEAVIPLFLGYGVNPYMELAVLSQKTGIVVGTSGRFKFAESDEQLAHGVNNFAQLLNDDQDLYKSLREKVIAKLGLIYDPKRKVVNPFHDHEFNKRL